MDTMLLLPIRGGIGTGTNHTGSVYFSDNNRLNHAAVNPIFSFVESVTHQEEIGTKYRFMENVEAEKLFKELTYSRLKENSEYINQHPNVILITLESFSDTIMAVHGITPNLRRLAREGIWFTNFYANSFRTDRALVSIHSGLPAQPTMSVMDIPHKSTSLPSIAGQLAKNGYKTVFYYGGDINYSNMRSYFMGTGFQQVVSESDFPSKKRISKWGVADGDVFDRMLTDIKTLYIDDLCVDENMRGKHIGTSLFEYVKAFAKENGFHNLTLNVWALNPDAVRFYEAIGMQVQKYGMELIL